jgi:DNA-damage-inducible protein J
MAQDSVVRARIDEKTKARAAKVFADCGLTLSDAIRIMLTRTAQEKAVPFSLHSPNKTTARSIKNLEGGRGKIYKAKDIEELLKQLNG